MGSYKDHLQPLDAAETLWNDADACNPCGSGAGAVPGEAVWSAQLDRFSAGQGCPKGDTTSARLKGFLSMLRG